MGTVDGVDCVKEDMEIFCLSQEDLPIGNKWRISLNVDSDLPENTIKTVCVVVILDRYCFSINVVDHLYLELPFGNYANISILSTTSLLI